MNDRFIDRSTEQFHLDGFNLFGTKYFRDKVLPTETKYFRVLFLLILRLFFDQQKDRIQKNNLKRVLDGTAAIIRSFDRPKKQHSTVIKWHEIFFRSAT